MAKPRLVSDWRLSWRWASVRIAAGAVVFGLLPPDQQVALLEWLGVAPERLPAVIGGLFIVGRIFKQGATDDPQSPQ